MLGFSSLLFFEIEQLQNFPINIFVNLEYFLKILMATEAVLQRCSIRKGVLRNFAKFPGKHLCQSLFFDKVSSLRLAT